MAYLSRLIHSAAIQRAATTRTETGQWKAGTYATVSGQSAVACLLQEGITRRMRESFGADVEADAVVYFPAGTDVRPNARSTGGQPDKLVITDEQARVSNWFVVGVQDQASARKGIVAAVKRAGA